MKRFFISIAAMAAVVLTAAACGDNGKTISTITPPAIPGNDNGEQTDEEIELGSPLPSWKEGEFDIHFINTTSGECMFLVFPDGTQMLIDAAGSQVATGTVNSTTNTGIRSRWDPTKDGILYGDFISDYIRKVMAWTGNSKIDYVLLTHLHNDHFGGSNGLPASDNSNTYTKQSLPLILDNFSVGKLMDRGYPEYNYPVDMATESSNASNCRNYITAVKWHVANKGLQAEKFVAGRSDQITLTRKPGDYPHFKVQNIAVNGEVWTGSGVSTVKTFPTLEEMKDIPVADRANPAAGIKCPPENITSCMACFSYGGFDFFMGGDGQYNGVSSFAWKDIETPAAKACGKVDVMKADHHGVSNTNGYNSKCSAMRYLLPRCWIVNSWTDGHPRPDVYNEVINNISGLDVYITNTCEQMEKDFTDFSQYVKGKDGHIVVRVTDQGSRYRVFVLTDSDGKMTVKKVSGYYTSR